MQEVHWRTVVSNCILTFLIIYINYLKLFQDGNLSIIRDHSSDTDSDSACSCCPVKFKVSVLLSV